MPVHLIQFTSLSSTTTTVSFLDIPQFYDTLLLKCSTRQNTNGIIADYSLRFNNDTGTVYNSLGLSGVNGGHSGYAIGDQTLIEFQGMSCGALALANSFGTADIFIPNYSSGSQWKSVYSHTSNENNGTSNVWIRTNQNIYKKNSSVTRIDLIGTGGTSFVAGSKFSLYGMV